MRPDRWFFRVVLGMTLWLALLVPAWAENPAPFAPSYKGKAKPGEGLPTLSEEELKSSESLRIWIKNLAGNLEGDSAASVDAKVKKTIFGYPLLRSYTTKDLRRQVEHERENGTLDCILTAECLDEVARRFNVTHTVQVAVSHQENGAWRIEMKLGRFGEEQERYFVEDVPDFADVPQALEQMLPDLIGKRSSLRKGEGVIRITSNPPGADVFVGGKLRGSTPLGVAGLHGTKIDIACRTNDHGVAKRERAFEEGEIAEEFFDFTTEYGRLMIDSFPAGASAWLDGVEKGVTPVVLEDVNSGAHALRLELAPFEPVEKQIDVKPRELTRFSHPFAPDTASLHVRCTNCDDGEGVEIWLDGRLVAEKIYLAKLDPGTYEVTLVRKGYASVTKTVQLKPGEDLLVEEEMEPGLSLRPGQHTETKPDWRPGVFTLLSGVMAVGFGVFLELEAQDSYDRADDLRAGNTELSADEAAEDARKEERMGLTTRIVGGTLMGLGSAAILTGVGLLIWKPDRTIAVDGVVTPKQAAIRATIRF